MSYDDKPWLKSYDEGVASEVRIPDISLADRFDEVLELFPLRPAIHFFGMTFTYEILMSHANRFAWMLIETGCKPGDVVAINLPNLPQYLIAQVGALKAGCATSGLSPLLTPNEMAYQLNDCKAKALVTLDAIFEHRLMGISDNLPHLKLIIATGILEFLPKIKQVLAKAFKKVPTGKLSLLPGKKIISFMDILSRYPDDPPRVKIDPEYYGASKRHTADPQEHDCKRDAGI
jgi:long-chain acyl-CoA synthetase